MARRKRNTPRRDMTPATVGKLRELESKSALDGIYFTDAEGDSIPIADVITALDGAAKSAEIAEHITEELFVKYRQRKFGRTATRITTLDDFTQPQQRGAKSLTFHKPDGTATRRINMKATTMALLNRVLMHMREKPHVATTAGELMDHFHETKGMARVLLSKLELFKLVRGAGGMRSPEYLLTKLGLTQDVTPLFLREVETGVAQKRLDVLNGNVPPDPDDGKAEEPQGLLDIDASLCASLDILGVLLLQQGNNYKQMSDIVRAAYME